MKKLFYPLVVFAGLFLLSANFSVVKASTIYGSHIGYKAVDSTHYLVTLTVYRDCNGINPSPVLEVEGKSSGNFTVTPTFQSKSDVTNPYLRPGCLFTSRCNGSYQYGVEEWKFTATIDVSGGACTYTFIYTECCRPGSITTGSANSDHYNYASINKCAGMNNSVSPAVPPRLILPVGIDAGIAPTLVDMTDKEDTIIYSLVSVLGPKGPVTYSGSFSPTKPFTHLGFPNNSLALPAGFHFNPVTAEINFRPTKVNEISVYCIESKEMRLVNGVDVVVGITRFEMTGIIISSPNNKPTSLSGTSPGPICTGTSNCFTTGTSDNDNGDTTFLTWSNTLPGAVQTVTYNGRLGEVATCWTPTFNDFKRGPYLYTVTGFDQICGPSFMAFQKTYALYVKKGYDSSNHSVVSKNISCSKVTVKAQKDPFPDLSLDWKAEDGIVDDIAGDSAVLYFTKPGWNRFAIRSKNSNGCLGPYEWDSVFISPSYTIQLQTTNDTLKCAGDSILLTATPQNGTSPYKYIWSDAPGLNNASIYATAAITQYYKVFVADAAGCIGGDSIRVASSAPAADIGPDTVVCKYTQMQLIANPTAGIAPFTYEWIGRGNTQTINTQVNDSTVFSLKITDSTGCYSVTNRMVDVYDFALNMGADQTVCAGRPATVSAEAIGGTAPFTFPWPPQTSTMASYTYTPAGDSVFTISIIDKKGCVAYDTVKITSNPPIIITVPSTAQACNGSNLTLTAVVSGGSNPYSYNWNGNVGSSNVFTFTVGPNTPIMSLKVTDAALCEASRVVNITMLPSPVAGAGADASYCWNGKVNLKATASSGTAPFTYAWSNGSNTDTTSFTAYSSGNYTVTVTDNNGCVDDDEVVITVHPRDVATITNPATICSNAQPFPLSASPNNGTWQGMGVTGGNFIPAVAGTGMHQLVYSFTGNFSCPMKDTTQIEVLGAPVADFSASAVSGGKPMNVNFFDISTGGATSWQWEIKDDNNTVIHTSALQNPSYSFTNLGSYSVKLIISNGQCTDTIEKPNLISVTNVGIADIENAGMKVYPNPAASEVVAEGENIATVNLTDIQGRETGLAAKQAAGKYYFDVSNLANGIYIIKITDAAGSAYHTKIIVNH